MDVNNQAIVEMLRNLMTENANIAYEVIKKYCDSHCDITKEMKIIKQIDDTHYTVRYNNKDYKAFSRYKHRVGENVYVTICCGNYSKMIIN